MKSVPNLIILLIVDDQPLISDGLTNNVGNDKLIGKIFFAANVKKTVQMAAAHAID